MIDVFEEEGPAATIAFEEVSPHDVSRYGIAQPKGDPVDVFELEDLVEKPSVADAPSNLAIAARYVCSAAVFTRLAETPPGAGGEIQLTDALRSLIRDGKRVMGVRLAAHEQRFDIGNFDSYFRAFTEFALADPDYGDLLREHLEGLLAKPSPDLEL